MIKSFLFILIVLLNLVLSTINERHATDKTSFQEQEMVLVKGGTFMMGSNEGREHEKPVHQVTLSDFYIARYEVTVEEYLEFVKATGKHHPEWMKPGSKYHYTTGTHDFYSRMGEALSNPKHPIMGVSWHDARAYCQWLSKTTMKKFRLPTEAEWEFAARGGIKSNGYLYAGSDSLDIVAWYEDNENKKSHQVGQKMPNELGLYDMCGNVCEWVQDDYGEYTAESKIDPIKSSDYGGIIFRGGGYGNSDYQCTVSFRNDNSRIARLPGIGFRVVREGE